jgi:hypothetical protein
MAQYQAYLVGKDGDHSRARIKEIEDCSDDASAIQQARTFVDGHDVELFSGDRPVAKLRSEDQPSNARLQERS